MYSFEQSISNSQIHLRVAFFKLTIHQGDRKIRRRPYRSPSLLLLPPGPGGGVRGAAEVVAGVPELVQRVENLPQPRPGAGVAGLPRLGPAAAAPTASSLRASPRSSSAAAWAWPPTSAASASAERAAGGSAAVAIMAAAVAWLPTPASRSEETRACWRPRRFNLKSTAAKIGSWLSSAYASKQRLFPDLFYFFGRSNR